MGAGADMTRVTLGKSRVREIRPPGSVRAKPNGRATRPRSRRTEISNLMESEEGDVERQNHMRERQRRAVRVLTLSIRNPVYLK
ncbi:hypothetical protein XH91_11375 [Bradyrhizobium guangzhouense]|uniref:Uncharacterized protein n=1 Tax=Bradyrhizobium guangzhouense TaxID=1325095 RepID=A0AAE6C7V3_9BRAD|nr:hypothetical protein XH91_11375 [Bradyrhizobium guangzhouense]